MATYDDLRERHLQTLLERFGPMTERLAWDAARLADFRQQRLRELVAHAVERSVFHRERLGHLDPTTLTEADLASVPTMTKADVVSRFHDIVTDPRVTTAAVEAHLEALDAGDGYLFDEYHVVATGGSSGTRTVIVWDWDGWAECLLSLGRRSMVQPRASDRPPIIASVSGDHPSHMTSALWSTFTSPLVQVFSVPAALPVPEIVRRLNEIQPVTLQGYPTMLHRLALEARAGRLRIAPETVLCGSETLTRETRVLLAETFGVAVQNGYGASEGGGIATDCGAGGEWLHMNDDVLIVEVEADRVLVTNLMTKVMPLLRYELDDRVSLVDVDCACGTAHRSVGEIAGRTTEIFTFSGGRTVHPIVFSTAIGANGSVAEYQVRQRGDALEVDVVPYGAVDVFDLRDAIERGLEGAGADGVKVEVRVVDDVPRSPGTGKARRYLPERT